jgi:fucokinase
MNVSQSLFLRQSYLDAWNDYRRSLTQSNFILWDYIILTASNEDQAAAYNMQLSVRRDRGLLPPSTHFAVLPDPGGARVGSGGATFNALKYIRAHAGCAAPFDGKRILVIHSGGDSKRVPQYSVCGKLFSPVPRVLPDGRRSTLFDEFIIGMSGVAGRITQGMLVCSGDALLLFNPLQIDFYGGGAMALSIKESAQTGRNHGVYLRDDQGCVGAFLHKQPIEKLHALGAVDERGNVDIDTGAVILTADILRDLYALVDTDEKFGRFVNETVRLSFYADFLYPMAGDSTLEQFQKEAPEAAFSAELAACRSALWQTLHKYRMNLIRLSPAQFIHFGTTWELLRMMTDDMPGYQFLDWSGAVNTNSRQTHFAASNAYISRHANVGEGSYIEDSYLHGSTTIGKGCVISGVTLDGEEVPDRAVIHGIKLKDGRFVVRIYGVDDSAKGSRLFGRTLDQPLWTAPIYPVCDTIAEAVAATLRRYKSGFAGGESARCLSLMESFHQADAAAILSWQNKLDDKVRAESLLEAIDARADLDGAVDVFRHGLSGGAKALLMEEARRLDGGTLEQLGRQMRIYRALSKLTGGAEKERCADLCFATIREGVLRGLRGRAVRHPNCAIVRDEVVVRLPVRVNFGGGWSDTPPYCMEHGGTVLNAAITLGGALPVEVVLRKIAKPRIILASADNASHGEFTQTAQLQDSSDPYDPFALHKAALIACDIIPLREHIPLETVLERLGSGFYLSTQVRNIPRGSGLGTSSILAGACVKGIYEFTGRAIDEGELYNRVLCIEQLMSTGGGWQDQVGGMTPGIKMLSTGAGMYQDIHCAPIQISRQTLDALERRFCLIYTGQRRLARNLLREVVGRYIDSQPQAMEALYEVQRLAVLMRFELEKGNVDGFARLMTQHWAVLKKLDAGSTNTCIDQIFLSIDDLIEGKMICGAGGGGFLQAVTKKGVSIPQIRERLSEVFADSGVDVWPSAFYF